MTIPVFYPMGAVTEKKEDKLKALWTHPSWIAERKYDGARYTVHKINGKISLLSRQPAVATGLPVDKTDRVPHLHEFFSKRLPNGTVLDGEIITHENCESNEVTSIMGCDPEKAIARQEERGYVSYVIFDVIHYDGEDLTHLPYYQRRALLEGLYTKLGLNEFDKILLAPVYTEDREQTYLDIVAGGGEGVVLKNNLGTYQKSSDPKKPKKPKNTWVKVKKYDTFDVAIMGFTEPTREYSGGHVEDWQYWEAPKGEWFLKGSLSAENLITDGNTPVTKDYYMGWIGAIVFGQYIDGELTRLGQTDGIADAIKIKIKDGDPELAVGQVMEVGSMRQNKSTGALVHPRFLHARPDKVKEQCILGED